MICLGFSLFKDEWKCFCTPEGKRSWVPLLGAWNIAIQQWRHSHNGTVGLSWFHLEMSGNRSFRDGKTAAGGTLVPSKEINEWGGFIW